MKPTEIRIELLEQHTALRALIDETCRATERWSRREGPREMARDYLIRLADGVRRHNLREEELLRDVIPKVNPWGPVRAEIMTDEHVIEHQELYDALANAAAADNPRELLPTVRGLRERMLEHMAREERSFLGEETLRDDDVSIDSFGG